MGMIVNLSSPPPPPPPVPGTGEILLGGWRIGQTVIEGNSGSLAVDFNTMTAYIASPNGVNVYNLPAFSTDLNINNWPRLSSSSFIPAWWPTSEFGASQIYPNGLLRWQNKLWVSPRAFYSQDTSATQPLILYAQDGATLAVGSLLRQLFSGFIKKGPGIEPYIGCGGYESSARTMSGPCIATMAGGILLEYQWPDLPGADDPNGVPVNWNLRAPRDTNYRGFVGPLPNGPYTEGDSWVAWSPRIIQGTLQGRWASDVIYGGGLILADGITFWPTMGLGDLKYANQTKTFCEPSINNRVYKYKYNASTFQFVSFADAFPSFVNGSAFVQGHELGPDGKVYLSMARQYIAGGGVNLNDGIIYVYI